MVSGSPFHEQLLLEVRECTTFSTMSGLPEPQAIEALGEAQKKVRKIQRLTAKLQAMQSEFPKKQKYLSDKSGQLQAAVDEEARNEAARKVLAEKLKKRQTELGEKTQRILHLLEDRAQDAKLLEIQKSQIWTTIQRLSELCKAVDEVIPKGHGKADTDVLALVLTETEERIIQIRSRIDQLAEDAVRTPSPQIKF